MPINRIDFMIFVNLLYLSFLNLVRHLNSLTVRNLICHLNSLTSRNLIHYLYSLTCRIFARHPYLLTYRNLFRDQPRVAAAHLGDDRIDHGQSSHSSQIHQDDQDDLGCQRQ